MRLIFLFFVALNAVFFFWQSGGISGQVKHAEKDLTAIPVNVNKLVLVGETEDKQAARAATKTTKDPGKKEQSKTDKLQTADGTTSPPKKDGKELYLLCNGSIQRDDTGHAHRVKVKGTRSHYR